MMRASTPEKRSVVDRLPLLLLVFGSNVRTRNMRLFHAYVSQMCHHNVESKSFYFASVLLVLMRAFARQAIEVELVLGTIFAIATEAAY
jgi:hypothetical protein